MANVNNNGGYGISIELDLSEIEDKLAKLKDIENGVERALRSAVNAAVSQRKNKDIREFVLEQAENEYAINTIKRDDLKAKIKSKRATSSLSATLKTNGRPTSLVYFNLKEHKKPSFKGSAPAMVQVKKGSGLKPLPKAFVATMPNGHTGAFVRAYNPNTGKKTIKELFSISLSQIMAKQSIAEKISKEIETRFYAEIDGAIDKVIRKAMRDAAKNENGGEN